MLNYLPTNSYFTFGRSLNESVNKSAELRDEVEDYIFHEQVNAVYSDGNESPTRSKKTDNEIR